ncbi:MAG: hypothetical protein PHW89_08165 [Sulfurimonas denitrificans]|nr:hypothetical protein [Sulfurimonas denitrificans]
MKVVSNEARTITIEGVAFTPDPKGVIVPDEKLEAINDNFFFKHYVSSGSFEIKTEAPITKETTSKRRGK